MTPTRIGPYAIVAPLGAGGMGQVFRAHDSRLDRHVAIKMLPDAFAADPDRVARFKREAQTLAALNHPHIAQIYGVEEVTAADGHRVRALVMELVEGETLGARVAGGALPVAEALSRQSSSGSVDGGTSPQWRADGRELFYVSDSQGMMAVPIRITGPTVDAGQAIELFRMSRPADLRDRDDAVLYRADSDGARFLMAIKAPAADRPPIHVILNWTALMPE